VDDKLDNDRTITDRVSPGGVFRPYVRMVADGYPALFDRGRRPDDFVTLYQALNYLEWLTKLFANTLAAVATQGAIRQDADRASLVRSFSDKRSFGEWSRVLDLTWRLASTSVRMPRRQAVFVERSVRMLAASRAVKVRNDLIGHGVFDASGADYRRAYDQLRQGIDFAVLLRELLDFAGWLDERRAEGVDFDPFVRIPSGPDDLWLAECFELEHHPMRAVYTNYPKRKQTTRIVHLRDANAVLASEPFEADVSFALEELHARRRMEVGPTFVPLTYAYSELGALVSRHELVHVVGLRGAGKSIFALFANEHLGDGFDVIYFPVFERLVRSRHYLQGRLERALSMPPNAGFEQFLQSLRCVTPERAGVVVAVVDGIDEVSRGELAALEELREATRGLVCWVFGSRPLREVDNELGDAIGRETPPSLVIDPEAAAYVEALEGWLGAWSLDSVSRQTIASVIGSGAARTFLDVRLLIAQAELGLPIEGDLRAAEIAEGFLSSDSALADVASALAVTEMSLSGRELDALLHDAPDEASFVEIRELLERYAFLLKRRGSSYSFAHVELERAARRRTRPELIRSLLDRMIAYLTIAGPDLRTPRNIRDVVLRSFVKLSSHLGSASIEEWLAPDDLGDSFMCRREAAYAAMRPRAREPRYWEHWEDTRWLYERHPKLCGDRRILEQAIVLFNGGSRDIGWELTLYLQAVVAADLDLVPWLIGVLDRFDDTYGHLEGHPSRSGSIRSSLFMILADVYEGARVELDRRGLRVECVRVLREGIANPKTFWLNRPLERLLAIDTSNETYDVCLAVLRDKFRRDPVPACTVARHLVRNRLRQRKDWRSTVLLMQAILLDMPRAEDVDVVRLSRKDAESYLLQLAVKRLEGDVSALQQRQETELLLRSGDWRERTRVFSDPDYRTLIDEVLSSNEVLRHRIAADPDARVVKALIDWVSGGEVSEGVRRTVKRHFKKQRERSHARDSKRNPSFLHGGRSELDSKSDLIDDDERKSTLPMIDYLGAMVIVRAGQSFLFQRKTAGYPVETYVGRLALIGGGAHLAVDANPRATLRRELDEELTDPRLARAIFEASEYVGAALLEIEGLEPGRKIASKSFLYVAELPPDALAKAELREGAAVVVSDLARCPAPMCWGHDHVFAQIVGRAPLDTLDPHVEMQWLADPEPRAYHGGPGDDPLGMR